MFKVKSQKNLKTVLECENCGQKLVISDFVEEKDIVCYCTIEKELKKNFTRLKKYANKKDILFLVNYKSFKDFAIMNCYLDSDTIILKEDNLSRIRETDLKIIQKSKLVCPFCKTKKYSQKATLKEHAETCLKNPKNRTCFACKYYKKCDILKKTEEKFILNCFDFTPRKNLDNVNLKLFFDSI